MKIGILKMGDLPPAMAAAHGEYDEIFERLLHEADPGIETARYDICGGAPLPDPKACDGWLLTGSRHGVYDDLPWIEPTKQFLRDAIAAHVPVVGVCFGHQLLAEALGGRAEKSDMGWMLGVKEYEQVLTPGWMEGLPAHWGCIAVHQDQVVTLPEDATVLSRAEGGPFGAVAYGDPEAPYAISVQPHPEYSEGMLRDLVDQRMQGKAEPAVLDAAIASLGRPLAGREWIRAMLAYLGAAQSRRPEGVSAQI